MKCNICGFVNMDYYFSKEYQDETICNILPKAEYYRCPHCGFVYCKTLAQMPVLQWEQLNYFFHSTLERVSRKTLLDQPPYIHHIQMLHILSENKIISLDNALDFAAGYGNMVRLLKKYYNKSLLLYDPYMQQNDGEVEYIEDKDLGKYDLVFSSAFFEHSIKREYLDKVNSLVSPNGTMMIYTYISDAVPCDPNWFYLDPVHCSFHTRKSMEILMKQWGYTSSLYCIPAETWCIFKSAPANIKNVVEQINSEFQQRYLLYDSGFVFP